MAKETAKENTTTPEQTEAPVATPELTIEQLMAQMQTALDGKDFKAVSSISRQIDQRNRAVEKAALDEKRAKADEIGKIVLTAITSAVEVFVRDGILDSFDGVWFSYDFGEQAPTIRLVKTATKATRSGNGGTGKKFDISTDDMLSKFGEEPYKESGMTFKVAYDSNTDKNWRYAIRTALLKKQGII
jgi:hypothetical protein